MFELDVRSRKPIYEQLVENIKELIISEVLKPDEKLPSVRALAQQLTINPNTIQKAYRVLENQGYIYSVQAKGSFVSPMADKANTEKMKKMKEELAKLLAEAMFYGISKEELYEIISEVEKTLLGGEEHD